MKPDRSQAVYCKFLKSNDRRMIFRCNDVCVWAWATFVKGLHLLKYDMLTTLGATEHHQIKLDIIP